MCSPDNPIQTMTPEQVAEALGIKKRTLAAWRSLGKGPRFYRVGKQHNCVVIYRTEDVNEWLERHAVATA